MHDDLGERLLQAGVITQAQLSSLQSAPSASGGAMVRDVLRLGAADTAVYSFFERRGYGPPADAALLANHDATLAARVPRSTVNRLLAVPLSRASGTILTAMADPSDRAAVAELAHRLDSPIRTVLARVSDLEALIQRAYGDGTPSAPPRRSTASYERVTAPDAAPQVAPPDVPPIDLVARPASEPAQLRMPPGVMPGTAPESLEPPIPLVRPAAAKPASAPSPGPLPVLERPSRDDVTKLAAPSAFGSTATRSAEPVGSRSSRPPAQTERQIPNAPPRDVRPPTGPRPNSASFNSIAGGPPVPIENSLREIARATERDVVLRAACQAAATVCRSAVFLARRRDLLIGWEGAGIGISTDAIRELWLPISGPSVFRDALSRARDYMGPPGSSSIDCVYRAVTGSRGGITLVRPLMLRGKVIALLAVDGLAHGDQGAMRITTVVNAVIEAFERIILANKAAGRSSEPPEGI